MCGRDIAENILCMASSEPDGRITYGELYSQLNNGAPFKGQNCQRWIMARLGRAACYCANAKLPLITSLVVRANSRTAGPKAIQNMYDFGRQQGFSVGNNPAKFVAQQASANAALALNQLPNCRGCSNC